MTAWLQQGPNLKFQAKDSRRRPSQQYQPPAGTGFSCGVPILWPCEDLWGGGLWFQRTCSLQCLTPAFPGMLLVTAGCQTEPCGALSKESGGSLRLQLSVRLSVMNRSPGLMSQGHIAVLAMLCVWTSRDTEWHGCLCAPTCLCTHTYIYTLFCLSCEL